MLNNAPSGGSASKLRDIRYVGVINGGYSLSSRNEAHSDSDAGKDRVSVFACRTISISTSKIAIVGPVQGLVGEGVHVKLEGFDIISGTIYQLIQGGIIVGFEVSEAEQLKIAKRIDWAKKRKFSALKDKRVHKRIMPPQPRTAITLANGNMVEGFIIDVSVSGIAISADLQLKVGDRLAVGKAIGVVVRMLDVGFAVNFEQQLDLNKMDEVFRWSLAALDKKDDQGTG